MRRSTPLVLLISCLPLWTLAAPIDDVTVNALPGPASCYPGTAGADNALFLRTKVDQLDCDFSGGGQICLNRREFAEDGANGRPISLGSPLIQRLTVSGDGTTTAFAELGFNACLMATASAFDEGCAGRDLFGIDPHTFSINPAGTQVALTRIDLGSLPNAPWNEIYLLNSVTLALEEFHAIILETNPLQVESVDFTVDGDYLIIDAFNPVSQLWGIYAVDRSDSSVTALVPPVAGLQIRNPSLAQTSDDHMVFDAQDLSTGANTVFAANLLTGDLSVIANTALLSYPAYTGDDRAVVFSTADATVSTTASLDIQSVEADRMTKLGSATRWLTNGGAGAIYRRGTWNGTLKNPADCGAAASTDLALRVIDPDEGAYLPGSSLNVYTEVENVSAVSSPPYTINYYLSSDTNISDTDTSLGFIEVNPLGAGQFLRFNATLSMPNDTADGPWYVGAILGIADEVADNNVNHDPTAIEVSSDPVIEVRPLSLDYVEPVPGDPSSGASVAGTDLAGYQNYRLLLRQDQSLRNRIRESGAIRVVIGFETPFRPEGALSAAARQAQRQGIAVGAQRVIDSLRGLPFSENARFEFVPFLGLTVGERALERLFNLPFVTSIEQDRLFEPAMATSNQVVGTPAVWAEGLGGAGQTVAVLDTGVDNNHPWFNNGGSKVVSEACYSSNIPEQNATSLCPGGATEVTGPDSGLHCANLCSHGTHVAGTAVGNDGTGPGFGVAREADLIAIQVFSKFTDTQTCGGEAQCVLTFSTDQIKALERVYALRDTFSIAAVNMSLGGGQYFDQATCDTENAAMKTAIDNLRSVEIPTVIASGNSYYRDSIGAPACISTAISVGNTRRNDEVSQSSNIYPQIHLLAPGTDIDSAVPGTTTELKTGTSMAAPHVAGAWAVMKQVYPGETINQILTRLQTTATLVNDNRLGGTVTEMPRINIDNAIGTPRTTFGIFNRGPATLNVASISPETSAPWISLSPGTPFEILAYQMQVVTVTIDYDQAPPGTSQVRLLVNSNDPNDSPLPSGVYINVTTPTGGTEPEFDSTPAANGTLAFGELPVGQQSAAKTITVRNIGGGELNLSCAIVGGDAGSFDYTNCPTDALTGGSSEDISITCSPESEGAKSSSLQLTTNDSDEVTVEFNLTCSGLGENMIFADGFES